MGAFRDSIGLLLIVSLAGCHADMGHGYLRGGPSLSIAGRPQLSMERVQTASFRTGLPPSELAQVQLERWPRSKVYGHSSTDASMNWSESTTVDSAPLVPGIDHSSDDNALASLDSEPPPSQEQFGPVSPPAPQEFTYRRPVVRIGLLELLKQRLQSGGEVIENKASGTRDWCRETGELCNRHRCDLRSQFGEVWDEFNPQYWVESTCQSCGDRTREFTSTLRERADDVCCPDWIGPARDRLSLAGDHLSGGLGAATENLGRVKDQFNEVTDSIDYLQPLSDFRPAVDLPKPDLKGLLQPILKTPEQHPGPPPENASTSTDKDSDSTDAIKLPLPADLTADESTDKTDEATEEQPDAAAAPADNAPADFTQETEATKRRPVRKTDRWKKGLK